MQTLFSSIPESFETIPCKARSVLPVSFVETESGGHTGNLLLKRHRVKGMDV